MKILILGTSNSVLRNGWVTGLRDALPEAEIENRSVGASPGVQFATELETDFASYDYVLLDSLPNDEEYQQFPRVTGPLGYSSGVFANRIIYEIAATIAKQTKLILVGFCRREFLLDPSPSHGARLRIARALGIQFLDVRALVLAYKDAHGLTVRAVYEEHASHPLAPLSALIGKYLGQAIAALPPGRFEATGHPDSYQRNFTTWRAADAGLGELRRMSNSLLTETFGCFSEHDELTLPVDGKCLGFHVNMFDTHCVAGLLDEAGKTICDVGLFHECLPDKLMKIFVPLPNGMAVERIVIKSGARNPGVRGLLSKPTPVDGTPTKCAISTVLFWRGDCARPWDETLKPEEDSQFLTRAIERELLSSPPVHDVTKTGKAFASPYLAAVTGAAKRGRLGIVTSHQTVVCIDAVKGHVLHRDLETVLRTDTLYPLGLQISGSRARFFFGDAGLQIFLPLSDQKTPEFRRESAERDHEEYYQIKFSGHHFTLNAGGMFLGVKQNGGLGCSRSKASQWELFRFQALV